VAKKRHSWPCEDKGPCLQDEDHGAGVLRLPGDGVHELRPQGVHSQREIHHQSPGDLPEEFEEEEAGDREGGSGYSTGTTPQSTPRRLCRSSSRKKNIKLLSHPPYSPDLAPADYFLFPKLKKELAGITMTHEEFKKEWEGVLRRVSMEEFAKAFVRWFERCEKCIHIDGNYVEKS
jgi:hypothetical protein